jgi:polar amino acid transport system substrate-binding protein
MRRTLPALLLLGAAVLAACGDDDDDDGAAPDAPAATTAPASVPSEATTAPSAGGEAAECAAGKTIEPDVLTIATGDPAFPPYVINDATPEDGQGFEAAVAMAVARELGFTGDAVTWVRTPFDAAIAPGPKNFDFNLQQYGITPERQEVVDMSEGYYTAPQAIFGLADSPAASATTIDDLKSLKIGVAAGTTCVDYVENTIEPESDPFIFNDNAAAKTALESNQIDAVVSDLPTAIYITTVEIEGTKVFGQIEGSGTDEWGLLLAKDSPLTECVNMALETLESTGELEQITTTWMSDYTDAPMITAS